jgi:tRNA threonylcarbamoyladenosine biosynthesis protein TsaE
MERISHFELSSIAQTEHFGQTLGRLLFPGAVIALVGPLGAGKTFLTRAIAQGLGIDDPALVTSPTFVLIQEYKARWPIYHFDVYRLKQGSGFTDLGAAEYFAGEGVSIIEWADKVMPLLPREHLRIELLVSGDQARQALVTAYGERYDQLLNQLSEVLPKIR